MTAKTAVAGPGVLLVSAALGRPAAAQEGENVDWPLHNFDLAGSRFFWDYDSGNQPILFDMETVSSR